MLTLYFDGACQPNADGGRMGYGGIIYLDQQFFYQYTHPFFRKDSIASNNIAEYCGLIAGLKYFLHENLQERTIMVFGDSKLVIEQMRGNWQVNDGKYVQYAHIAAGLVLLFDDLRFEWLPKEQNKEADELSRRFI